MCSCSIIYVKLRTELKDDHYDNIDDDDNNSDNNSDDGDDNDDAGSPTD